MVPLCFASKQRIAQDVWDQGAIDARCESLCIEGQNLVSRRTLSKLDAQYNTTGLSLEAEDRCEYDGPRTEASPSESLLGSNQVRLLGLA